MLIICFKHSSEQGIPCIDKLFANLELYHPIYVGNMPCADEWNEQKHKVSNLHRICW